MRRGPETKYRVFASEKDEKIGRDGKREREKEREERDRN